MVDKRDCLYKQVENLNLSFYCGVSQGLHVSILSFTLARFMLN